VADNSTYTDASGVAIPVASDDIGGVKYPRGKMGFGVDGAYVDVSATNPAPVTLATTLDASNDSIRARIISGVLDDGAGSALTVKTARGTASSSGVNTVVAAVTGKKIRVLAYSMQAASANGSTVVTNFQDDSGSPVILSQTWEMAAREGISKALSMGPGFYFQTTVGQALKLNLGSALSVYWEVVYVEA
jgi:hypothetical protein